MARILVRDIAAVAEGALPAGTAGNSVVARSVIAAAGDPIHLHSYELAAGGTLAWQAAPHGRTAYVHRGAVTAGGIRVGAGGTVTIEHGAAIMVEAEEASLLLVFEAVAMPDGRLEGGHVHILPPGDVPRCLDFDGGGRVGGALFADAACPTCELWLHETILHPGGHVTPVHSHSEDEVIVVVDGEIVLGRRIYGPGTAIAVAQGTLYGFDSGVGGLTFINFRPKSPIYVPADRSRAAIDEREYYLARMAAPEPRTIAAAPA